MQNFLQSLLGSGIYKGPTHVLTYGMPLLYAILLHAIVTGNSLGCKQRVKWALNFVGVPQSLERLAMGWIRKSIADLGDKTSPSLEWLRYRGTKWVHFLEKSWNNVEQK